MKSSRLSDIPGIGSKLIKSLLTHFNSVEAIQIASLDELSKVDGVGKSKAKIIWNYFT